jgi:hypothetical protein
MLDEPVDINALTLILVAAMAVTPVSRQRRHRARHGADRCELRRPARLSGTGRLIARCPSDLRRSASASA